MTALTDDPTNALRWALCWGRPVEGEMGHTPGPWTMQAEKLAGERQWWVYADGARPGRRLVAMCSGPDARGNAQAIEALPDLLAALEEIAHAPELTLAERQDIARAAIRKATA